MSLSFEELDRRLDEIEEKIRNGEELTAGEVRVWSYYATGALCGMQIRAYEIKRKPEL